jgi:hypothetical protein
MQRGGMGIKLMDIMAVPQWQKKKGRVEKRLESQKSYHSVEVEHGKLRQEQR